MGKAHEKLAFVCYVIKRAITHINFDATFCGAEKHEPVKMTFVC